MSHAHNALCMCLKLPTGLVMACRVSVPQYGPYRAPAVSFRQLAATEKLDYFLVLDFEANKGKIQEIIEFPVVKVNAKDFKTEAEFHYYVQPVVDPVIDPFITDLTGITQDMVTGKPTLPEVLKSLDEWMKKEGLLEDGVRFCFVTCGDWDLKKALPVNCDYLQLYYPDYLKRWINIKSYFATIMHIRQCGMDKMLDHLGLQLDGKHHSGIDDSRNIAKILRELAKRNENLRKGLVEPRVLVIQ